MRYIAPVLLGCFVSACSAAPAPATAQAPGPEPAADRTLRVSADAAVMRAPDRAAVRLAVETTARTADEATAGTAAAVNAVLDAVARLGVDRDRIQTTSVSLRPRFQREPNAEPRITGYIASNQVRVPVSIDRLGPVVDAAVGAGANRVLGISFEISDPEAAYHEALQRAIAQARREAEVAAAALGETLGPPVQVVTGGLPSPAPQARTEMMQLQASGTPVQPGQLEVRASVSITYRLGQ